MAIGQRIPFFRNRKGMTQKQLGEILGFLGKTSDVRMAQYGSEARTPKQDLLKEMGFHDIAKPGMMQTAGRFMTIPKGAAMKKISLDFIKNTLQEKGFQIEEEEIE